MQQKLQRIFILKNMVEKMNEEIEKSILKFPEMIGEAIKYKIDLKINKKPKNIIIAGMGGSAIAGDILIDFVYSKLNIPIYVCKDYSLPCFVNKDSLVFIVSYSGNTEETLSCFKEAKEKNAILIGITSDGELEKIFKKYRLPLIKIPSGFQPRVALPYLFFSIIVALKSIGILKNFDKEIKEAIKILKNIRKKYSSENKLKKFGEIYKIAKNVKKSDAIIIYSPESLKGVATRIKNQINENSKMLAWIGLIPEIGHNEISGWQEVKKSNFSVLLLRDRKEDKRIKIRFEYIKKILKEKAKIYEIFSEGKSELAKIFSLIYLGDILSLHIANERNVDAKNVPLQEKIKEILKKSNFK